MGEGTSSSPAQVSRLRNAGKGSSLLALATVPEPVAKVTRHRAGMTRHLMDGRGNLQPHDRAAPTNGFLDWTGLARTDDPAEMATALERAGMTLDDYLAA